MTEATRRAVFTISVDGGDVTGNFAPYLISMSIKLADGGKSDTFECTLDDAGGQIALPREGATLRATLAWADGGGRIEFEGKTDEPASEGSRGGGMILSLSAKAADMKGRGKAKKERHKDDATFEEAAKHFAKGSGFEVKIDGDLAKVKRDYWAMANESFFSWGARIAEELGATFKAMGGKAVFVPRNSGKSVSGQPLQTVRAEVGVNLINWRLSPVQNRARYRKARVRHYDRKEAKWKVEDVEIDGALDSDLVETVKAANKDNAKDRATANSEESKRGKGGGSITIDGDPAAQAQAPCVVAGVRAGIDGDYRITSATHTLSRGSGWTTQCELEQPQGAAGADGRKAGKQAGETGHRP